MPWLCVGAIDFGVASFTCGSRSFAGHGALRIIGGLAHEVPGFHFFAYIAWNRALRRGPKPLKDLAGHPVATTQIDKRYVVGDA